MPQITAFLRGIRVAGGDELVVDELFFPLVLSTMESRVMLITKDSFQRMLAAMDSMLGSGESLIAFQEGSALGSVYSKGPRGLKSRATSAGSSESLRSSTARPESGSPSSLRWT